MGEFGSRTQYVCHFKYNINNNFDFLLFTVETKIASGRERDRDRERERERERGGARGCWNSLTQSTTASCEGDHY